MRTPQVRAVGVGRRPGDGTGEPTERPLPGGTAAVALAACALRVAGLCARRRLRQPAGFVGRRLRFADGTGADVYRETTLDRPGPAAPALLVVTFRLRGVHRPWAHALFRLESVLNTALFAGFPGFVSKLWLRHDEQGRYRGVYEWDGADRAMDYVRALWWVLAPVSATGSIHCAVIPGLRRDNALRGDRLPDDAPSGGDWWRLLPAATGPVQEP